MQSIRIMVMTYRCPVPSGRYTSSQSVTSLVVNAQRKRERRMSLLRTVRQLAGHMETEKKLIHQDPDSHFCPCSAK